MDSPLHYSKQHLLQQIQFQLLHLHQIDVRIPQRLSFTNIFLNVSNEASIMTELNPSSIARLMNSKS